MVWCGEKISKIGANTPNSEGLIVGAKMSNKELIKGINDSTIRENDFGIR
jgi:hypothetical protein